MCAARTRRPTLSSAARLARSVAAGAARASGPPTSLVRLETGEFVALRDRLPHPDPECVAAYRPEVTPDDRAGWFFEPCRNAIYDMAGHRMIRRWPRDLDRLGVEVRDGLVYVDPYAITRGLSEPQCEYEPQAGGVLLPTRRY